VVNTNSYDLLITYEFVCVNSHVSIRSTTAPYLEADVRRHERMLFFFMCEGPIRVEQILAGRNRRF
jgi:hypothetical protein